MLIPNLCEAVLLMFKSFILIFKQKTPQVQKLYLKFSEVTGDLFACILKDKSVKGLSGSKFKKSKLNELHKTKDFFIVASYENLHESWDVKT